ncbi:MAG: Cof-type HAD-IIB family hydrolase [Erysipelotrichaceae bacterium]|nr:Cof-type HAD-IIB family hydrolase [Erysipelotrichaceae bacterium]
MIRAILLDIDGTLTNSQKVITPKTAEALKKAQAMGVRLVIASGRADQGLYQYADVLDMPSHHGIFVCYNGAKVMDCQTKEVYFHQPMSIEEGKAVLEHMKKFEVSPIIAKDEYMYTNDVYAGMIHKNIGSDEIFNVIQYESRGNFFILCEKRDLAAFADFPIEKILTAGEPEYLRDHWQEMGAPFRDTLSCMFTAPFYYEFTAKNVDKAKAIDTAFTKLGYTADEMIAFGDAENDISMLEYAGIGVAMGNATEAVKAIADEITLSNDEDGIAESLYKHIEGLR